MRTGNKPDHACPAGMKQAGGLFYQKPAAGESENYFQNLAGKRTEYRPVNYTRQNIE
jgi:hypothetical protein